MSDKNQDVKFIRKNGKVIPVKATKGDKEKKAKDVSQKKTAQKKKPVATASKGKSPKFEGKNTANAYWQAENYKTAAAQEGNRRATIGLAGSAIALQAAGGAIASAATGTKGGALAAVVGAGVSYAGGRLAKNNFKAHGRMVKAHEAASSIQSDTVREEMRRQGHKKGGSIENFNSSLEKTLNSINNSAGRQGRKKKSDRSIYNSYKGY